MAGGGGVAQVGNLGVVNFAVAPSFANGHAGAQYSAGVERIGRIFSIGGSAIMADRNYRDVASENGDGVPRKQLSAFTGLSLKRFGSGGLAYATVNMDGSPVPLEQNTATAQHSQMVSANYSIQVHHVFLYANEFRDLVNKGSSGLQIGFTIPFGKRSSVTASGSSNGSAQLEVQKPAPLVGDWGYEAYLSWSGAAHVFAQGQHKSSAGMFTAGVDSDNGATTLRLESQGAFSFVDGELFPSNTIYDSFAVVDTGTMAHVHVLQENRDVGSTNSSGRLLVPDMRAFDVNQIAVAPTDIPPDVTLDVASRQVRPQDRSGVVLKFRIKFSHGALLRLVDGAGAAVPLGSTATLRSTGVVVPVGYDGDAYVEDLNTHNQLAVEFPDGHRCAVAFDYAPVTGEIPTIGPLRCLEKNP
jgi:outer membrane usher protein